MLVIWDRGQAFIITFIWQSSIGSRMFIGLLFWPALSPHWAKFSLALLARLMLHGNSRAPRGVVGYTHTPEFVDQLTLSPSCRYLSVVNPKFASSTSQWLIQLHTWPDCFLSVERPNPYLISVRLFPLSTEYLLASTRRLSKTIDTLIPRSFLPTSVGSISA